MVEHDYILRMIEQAGTVLKRLLRLVSDQGANREQLTNDLQQAAQLGGLDLDILRICDVEGLRHLVTLTGELDPKQEPGVLLHIRCLTFKSDSLSFRS